MRATPPTGAAIAIAVILTCEALSSVCTVSALAAFWRAGVTSVDAVGVAVGVAVTSVVANTGVRLDIMEFSVVEAVLSGNVEVVEDMSEAMEFSSGVVDVDNVLGWRMVKGAAADVVGGVAADVVEGASEAANGISVTVDAAAKGSEALFVEVSDGVDGGAEELVVPVVDGLFGLFSGLWPLPFPLPFPFLLPAPSPFPSPSAALFVGEPPSPSPPKSPSGLPTTPGPTPSFGSVSPGACDGTTSTCSVWRPS